MDKLYNIETPIYTHQEGIKKKQITKMKENNVQERKEINQRISYDSQHSPSSWSICTKLVINVLNPWTSERLSKNVC